MTARIKTLRHPLREVAAMAAFGLLVAPAASQDDLLIAPPHPLPCPTMQAGDITAPGAPYQDIKVFFHWWLDIDRTSLGDGDIAVRGPDGYAQRGALVSVEEVFQPFAIPHSPLPVEDDSLFHLPQPVPTLVATYRVFPPEPADAWVAAHNGGYSVHLIEGEVLLAGGAAIPPKLLGGFRVAIGEPHRIFPVETRVTILREPLDNASGHSPEGTGAVFSARVDVFFRTPHVRIDWGDLKQDGQKFEIPFAAYGLPLPEPEPVAMANAADEPNLHGDGDVDPAPPTVLPHFSKTYRLGVLAPGHYVVAVTEFGETLARKEFVVADDPPVDDRPPSAALHARNVTAAVDERYRFSVVYEDRSGIDVGTLGDGDAVVFSPCLFHDVRPPFPCPWEAQRARLVEVIPGDRELRRVTGIYAIDPPPDGWTHEHNGFYTVALRDGEVCDRVGNCVSEQRLGGFEVAIRPDGLPPVPAEAEVAVDASDPDHVHARVRVDFKRPWHVVSQNIRRDGNRIFLLAKAEPAPVPAVAVVDPPPPSQDLLYRIGALAPGKYAAVFVMNGHVYDAAEFAVGEAPPIRAEVRLEAETASSGETVIHAVVEFAEPHHVHEAGIERHEGMFVVLARAEPVDPNTDGPTPPNPAVLSYRLGPLEPGSYFAAFVMNGHRYAALDFDVEPKPGFDVDVDLKVDPSSQPVTAVAVVDFADPFVVVTDPGEPRRDGSVIVIDATAERVTFVREPDGDPVRFDYTLGELPAGTFTLIYRINGHGRARTEFTVRPAPPIPARADIAVDPSHQPVTAAVTVQFEDHYRIAEQGVRRDGNRIILHARADGPLPILAPIPPPPITLKYEVGELEPGRYVAAFVMNGFTYDVEEFGVRDDGGFDVDVRLAVDASGETVVATAVVDFANPYVVVTDPGTPVRRERWIEIRAVAEEVTFVQEPDGAPQTFTYDLGALPPGTHSLVYFINGRPEAHAGFAVPERPRPPLPHVAFIEIGETSDGHAAEVGVALLAGQSVTSWGEARRHENRFVVDITVDWTVDPAEPQPHDPNDPRAADLVGPDGQVAIGDRPVHLVTHTYRLGELHPGEYLCMVTSRDHVVARKPFAVGDSSPVARLAAPDVTEPGGNAYRFAIHFHDPDGLDHESIASAQVTVIAPSGDELSAELESYASTDNVPSTGGSGAYVIRPPGGTWDTDDHGAYAVVIEADKVRDLNGNSLPHGRLGKFHVRIWADPPDTIPVDIRTGIGDSGVWWAEVMLPPVPAVRVESWGEVHARGRALVAVADLELSADAAAVPLSHTYRLGHLRPGHYVFVFKSTIGHCGVARIHVPGEEGDAIDAWRELAFSLLPAGAPADASFDLSDFDRDGLSTLAEYFFGTDPLRPDRGGLRAEIIDGADGQRRLVLRIRRALTADAVRCIVETTHDLRTWTPVRDDDIEEVSRTVDVDGAEELVLCFTCSLEDQDEPFVRLRIEPTATP